MAIAAVVVCHNLENNLSETLAAVSRQSKKPDHTVVVLTPATKDLDRSEFKNSKLIWVEANSTSFTVALRQGLAQLSLTEDDWFWALTDQLVPSSKTLEALAHKAETTRSVGLIAPKIMDGLQPDTIREYGLTLTPRSSLFSWVDNQLDQSQNDHLEEVLGARIGGALLSVRALSESERRPAGFTNRAADLEFSIRLRLHGLRVVLEPAAKVYDFSAKPEQARVADFKLKLYYLGLFRAWLLAIALPLIVILEALWLMVKKQPERVIGELSAGFKTFFTAPAVFVSRKILPRKDRKNLHTLRPLYATSLQVRQARLARISEESASATSVGQTLDRPAPGFILSGGIWVFVALLAFSWQFWPTNVDVSGPGLLPLGSSWIDLFAATGSSWQNVGTGFFAPAEPFNWVLLALGSLTFWSPGLAMALLFFFAKSLAFASAWRALTLVTNKFWILTLGALGYAFWPSFVAAQNQGRLGAVLAHMLIPAFAFGLARTFRIGVTNQTRQATWGFTAITALTSAALSACAPSLAPIILLAFVAFAVINIRKIGYLIWLPVPLVVIWLPTVWYRVVGLLQPVSLLADPGLALRTKLQNPIELLLASNLAGPWQLATSIAVGAILFFGWFATLQTRSKTAVSLWVALALTVAGAWFFERVDFVGNPVQGQDTGQSWVNGSAHPLLSVAALISVLLVVLTIDSVRWARGAGLFVYPAVAILAISAMVSGSQLHYTDGRVAPAIVRAEAQTGSTLKLLVLRAEAAGNETGKDTNRFSATVVSGGGIYEENLNTSYRFALADQQKQNPTYSEIAKLASALVSVSGESLAKQFDSTQIGYVLVPDVTSKQGSALSSNLDAIVELDGIGITDFGQLWRVNTITPASVQQKQSVDLWSITKGVQLATLTLFILLALPARRRNQTLSADFDDFELGSDTENEGESANAN